MGLGSYFKAETGQARESSTPMEEISPRQPSQPITLQRPQQHHQNNSTSSSRRESQRDVPSALSMSEKPASALSFNDSELRPPSTRNFSRPQSVSGRSVRSARSAGSSAALDDIKHEVMVNYLYQQQCSHLWVSDGSGEVEGVLLRKSRGHYMACPPQLGNSPLAVACAALNVQVN